MDAKKSELVKADEDNGKDDDNKDDAAADADDADPAVCFIFTHSFLCSFQC